MQRIIANTRRALVEICEAIREQLALMGFDPALAVSLQRGEQATVEPAAIPDSETLRAADAAITRSDHMPRRNINHHRGTSRANGDTSPRRVRARLSLCLIGRAVRPFACPTEILS
jgi:hypothetical protein